MLLRVLALAALTAVSGCSGCEGDDDEVDAPGPPSRQVSIAWRVVDLNGAGLACERIGAQFVNVLFVRTATGEGFTEVFDCYRQEGTRELVEGEYRIEFELVDRFGTIATLPGKRYVVERDATLEEAVFQVDPFGGLVLSLDTGPAANCGGGSQITGMSISLYHADGTCELTTLAIAPSTSYAVNCTAPNVTGCIEEDRSVTAARIPADEYRIRVVGLQGPSPCWLYDQRQRVRAAGLSRTLVLPLMKTCN